VGVSNDSELSFGPPELFSAISQAANRCDLGIMVTCWSSQAPILYVNEAFAQMVGRTPQDLLGQEPWPLLREDEARRLQELHEERLRGRRVPGKFTTELTGPAGVVPVEISATAVGTGSGAVTVSFIEDITDQLRAEVRRHAQH